MSEFWLVKDPTQLTERLCFFEEWLRQEWDWSKPVQWKVSAYSNKRSLSQNALFHMWCGEMAEYFTSRQYPLTKDQAKLLMKHEFLGYEDVTIGKTVVENQLRHTSALGSGEMFEFMERVLAWAADKGLLLTCPADSEFMKLKGG